MGKHPKTYESTHGKISESTNELPESTRTIRSLNDHGKSQKDNSVEKSAKMRFILAAKYTW